MSHTSVRPLIAGVGIGLRAEHFSTILMQLPKVPWFEVIADNFLTDRGSAWEYLLKIREHYPIALHAVGLSLGSTDPLNMVYLTQLKNLQQILQPSIISEHLSWVSVQNHYWHQLLPLPFNSETLQHVRERIEFVQNFLQQEILIENSASYLSFCDSTMTEWDFINALVKQAGCAILLDINNVYVSAYNQKFSTEVYLDAIDFSLVKQLHLGGFTQHGNYLLDTHDQPIAAAVWNLYARAVERITSAISAECMSSETSMQQSHGLKDEKYIPTAIEWDHHVPEFSLLQQQVQLAQKQWNGDSLK